MENQTKPGKLAEGVNKKIAIDAKRYAEQFWDTDDHRLIAISAHSTAATEWAEKWWEEQRLRVLFEQQVILLENRDKVLNQEVTDYRTEFGQLQKENERLKAALEQIASIHIPYEYVSKGMETAIDIASKALASDGKEVDNE